MSAGTMLVAIDMGYGHLRPARALADVLGAPVLQADQRPLSGERERRLWKALRAAYGFTTRASQLGAPGAPLRRVVEALTAIPHLHPARDLSKPNLSMRLLRALSRFGLGQGLIEELQRQGQVPLLTTFFAPAVLADHLGHPKVFCVVTDLDVHRIWAPFRPQESRVVYLVPGERTRRRMLSYGVRPEQIHVTGFPLPHALLGGPELTALRENLAARLLRLDPAGAFREQRGAEVERALGALPGSESALPPRLTFAVGGTGAQVGLARAFLPGLRDALEGGRLRLGLVAGVRREVAQAFEAAVREAGLERCLGEGIEILWEADFEAYVRRFDALLARTDLLWTKPSELSFYAALGLPLILAPPIGVHERYNRRWLVENGAGLRQRDPRFAGEWLQELLADGTLAQAAWAGYTRLPKLGLYRIAELVRAAG